jgi:hypothetical protein
MDGPGDDGSALRERIDRLRGSAEPDTVTALTACIRTPDRGAARSLALAWLRTAELAVADDPPARGQGALALLARVLDVPAAYFTDPETARVVDGDRELAAGSARGAVATRGPCRTGVPSRAVGTVRDRLRRELERARRPG